MITDNWEDIKAGLSLTDHQVNECIRLVINWAEATETLLDYATSIGVPARSMFDAKPYDDFCRKVAHYKATGEML